MTQKADPKGRLQLILLATIFFAPLIIAAFMYFKGESLQPGGRVNHGALLKPIVSIGERMPDSALVGHGDDYWLLVYTNGGECAQECREALYTIRQSRLMLGREMERVKRVFLHGESAPDKVFLADEHEGLIALRDDPVRGLLEGKRPEGLEPGGYYLIDPLSNLVLYFPPGINPADMVDDIKRLLKLSRIG